MSCSRFSSASACFEPYNDGGGSSSGGNGGSGTSTSAASGGNASAVATPTAATMTTLMATGLIAGQPRLPRLSPARLACES